MNNNFQQYLIEGIVENVKRYKLNEGPTSILNRYIEECIFRAKEFFNVNLNTNNIIHLVTHN